MDIGRGTGSDIYLGTWRENRKSQNGQLPGRDSNLIFPITSQSQIISGNDVVICIFAYSALGCCLRTTNFLAVAVFLILNRHRFVPYQTLQLHVSYSNTNTVFALSPCSFTSCRNWTSSCQELGHVASYGRKVPPLSSLDVRLIFAFLADNIKWVLQGLCLIRFTCDICIAAITYCWKWLTL